MMDDKKYKIMQSGREERKLELLETEWENLNVEKECMKFKVTCCVRGPNF